MRRRDISALHYECNNSRSVSKSDIMTVPPRTGHIVHMFVFILCEMSEQENKFVLCGRILLNTNKTCLTQPLNKKTPGKIAAHPPLVWLSVESWCFALSKSGLSMMCSDSALSPEDKTLQSQAKQESHEGRFRFDRKCWIHVILTSCLYILIYPHTTWFSVWQPVCCKNMLQTHTDNEDMWLKYKFKTTALEPSMETLLKSFSLINQSVSQKHIIVRSSVFVITHIKWLIYGLILSNHMYTHTVHTHRHMHTHLSLQPSVSCADYHPHTHSRRVEGRSALIFLLHLILSSHHSLTAVCCPFFFIL